MHHSVMTRAGAAALLTLVAMLPASGQTGVHGVAGVAVKAVAEIEVKSVQDGRDVVKLAPAERVVPGDQVIYTLEIRNTGVAAVHAPSISYRIPAHMVYVADSATGPGAEVRYSIDGGRTFDRPENLQSVDVEGHVQPAKPMEYTDIRWQLKNTLKSNSVAYARFRAVVK